VGSGHEFFDLAPVALAPLVANAIGSTTPRGSRFFASGGARKRVANVLPGVWLGFRCIGRLRRCPAGRDENEGQSL
jgi:hypothetical protein